MNRLLPVVVALLVGADILFLGVFQKWRSQPVPADLSPRVARLEADLAQAQQDIGELKQEVLLLQRRGQPSD